MESTSHPRINPFHTLLLHCPLATSSHQSTAQLSHQATKLHQLSTFCFFSINSQEVTRSTVSQGNPDVFWGFLLNLPRTKFQVSVAGVMNVRSLISLILLLLLVSSELAKAMLSTSSRKSIKICLKNCGQCQRVYGDYFEGRRCADHCIATKGRSIPDCNDVESIVNFLSKLE